MKQNIRKTVLLSLFLIFTFSSCPQTILISSKYKIERTCLEKNADMIERFSYHLQDDYNNFIQQKLDTQLEQLPVDNGVFISRNSEKMYGKRILDIIDKELSNKEKNRLYKNHRLIFVTLSIDTKGNIILVELSSYGLMEKDISSKRMFNILYQIKKMTINDIRTFQNNGYINFTVVRRLK